MGGGQPPGVQQERAEGRRAVGAVEREVDPDVQAAVAEVPVRQAGQPVLGQQRVELAQVGAEPLRRDGGVLPARVRGVAVRRPTGQARRRPRGSATARRRARRRPRPRRPRRRRRGPARRRAPSTVAGVGAGQLDQQPALARGAAAARTPDRAGRAPRRRCGRPCPRRPPGRAAAPRPPRRRPPPSTGSRGRPAGAPARPGPAGPSRRGSGPACPRCRPARGRRRSRSPAAGARASSRTPGGRSGPARCGSGRGWRRPARAPGPGAGEATTAPPAIDPSRSRSPAPVTTSSPRTLSLVRP